MYTYDLSTIMPKSKLKNREWSLFFIIVNLYLPSRIPSYIRARFKFCNDNYYIGIYIYITFVIYYLFIVGILGSVFQVLTYILLQIITFYCLLCIIFIMKITSIYCLPPLGKVYRQVYIFVHRLLLYYKCTKSSNVKLGV